MSIKGKVIDSETKLPVSFATVVYQKASHQNGTVSDVHGVFEITDTDISSLTVSCIGYKSEKVSLSLESNLSNLVVELTASIRELNELVVTSKNNPAIRVIRNTQRNKRQNNFENYPNYSYRCYLKTIIDLKLSDEATLQDSLQIKNSSHYKIKAPFVSECIVSTLKLNGQLEHKIKAQKTSGLKDPLLTQAFVRMFHHSISFYNNSVSLFEIPMGGDKSISEYVGPLSDGCLSGYNYELEDRYLNNTDTIFMIHFKPKKGKTFNGLKGTLFINSNGFAIQSIVVEPADKGLISFKFRQDYNFVANKWFPGGLDEEVGWVSNTISKKSKIYPVYLITSKIDSVSYQPPTNQKINLEKVYLDDISLTQSEQMIESLRPDSLSARERKTYLFMDSVGRRYNLDYWAAVLPKLTQGKIPLKCIDVNLNKLFSRNDYEGVRLGIGLYTNEKLLKFVTLGGFAMYGFKDKKLKYGGELIVDINKYHEVQLKLSYHNSLLTVGSSGTSEFENSTFSDYLRSYLEFRYDHLIEKKIDFGFRLLRHLKLNTVLSINERSPTYKYTYKDQPISGYRNDAVEILANYGFGEELGVIGNRRYIQYPGNPTINFRYKRGLDIFSKNNFSYNRIEATLDYILYNGRIGQSNFRLTSGWIDRSLPYGLLFTGEGSKTSGLSFLINNSFQTMMPYEFLSDKYVHLFYSHNFGNLLLNTRLFKPQFIIVQNTGWGTLKILPNRVLSSK
ncbi:MAG: DUF5686 family protein [Paludibacteraceae bacterium]